MRKTTAHVILVLTMVAIGDLAQAQDGEALDEDGDGIYSVYERGSPSAPVDTDGDGIPNYRDADDDGDGVPTADEEPDSNHDGDPSDARSTANAGPDYLASDDDMDGIPTRDERPNGRSRDSDGDGRFDHRDEDDDADGLLGEGADDLDSDGVPNYLDPDDDGDLVESRLEIVAIIDTDGDGIADPYDRDDDGDSIVTTDELGPGGGLLPRDSDGDGARDYLDIDDDADRVTTKDEGALRDDLDGDGVVDYLDPDDDGDGLPTAEERIYEYDLDRDGFTNWCDLDSDADGIGDSDEGLSDLDEDGIPDFLDTSDSRLPQQPQTEVDAGLHDDAGVASPRDSGLTASEPDSGGCHVSRAARGISLDGLLVLMLVILAGARTRVTTLLWVFLLACADGSRGVFLLDPGGSGHDGDAAPNYDAGQAARDAEVADVPVVPSDSCLIEGDVLAQPIYEGGGRGWAALLDQGIVRLAYVVPTCGGAGWVRGTRIDSRTVGSIGEFSAAQPLTPGTADRCQFVGSPSLAVGAAGGVGLFFSGNLEGTTDIYRQDVTLASPPLRVTEDSLSAADAEGLLSAASFGDGPLLAYVNEAVLGGGTQLVTQRPGLFEQEIVPLSLGQGATQIALSAWPGGAAIGGVVGWVSERAGARAIQLQPLTLAGRPKDARVDLSTAAGGLSRIALASAPEYAAAVYTVQRGSAAELRFRPLGNDGRPRGAEVALTSSDRSVGSPAIAPYAKGHVVAFRELPLQGEASSTLRLLFVSPEGVIATEKRLDAATRTGGDAQVIVMPDGRLTVIWTDYEASGAVLRVVRARCL